MGSRVAPESLSVSITPELIHSAMIVTVIHSLMELKIQIFPFVILISQALIRTQLTATMMATVIQASYSLIQIQLQPKAFQRLRNSSSTMTSMDKLPTKWEMLPTPHSLLMPRLLLKPKAPRELWEMSPSTSPFLAMAPWQW